MFRQYSEDRRRATSAQLAQKYPDRVPVVVTAAPGTTLPPLRKTKFLAPCEARLSTFIRGLREQMTTPSDAAIFLYVNGKVLPPTSALMAQIHGKYRDPDGFLYITYASENVFG